MRKLYIASNELTKAAVAGLLGWAVLSFLAAVLVNGALQVPIA